MWSRHERSEQTDPDLLVLGVQRRVLHLRGEVTCDAKKRKEKHTHVNAMKGDISYCCRRTCIEKTRGVGLRANFREALHGAHQRIDVTRETAHIGSALYMLEIDSHAQQKYEYEAHTFQYSNPQYRIAQIIT